MKRVMLSFVMILLIANVATGRNRLRHRVTALEVENAEQQLQIDQNTVDIANLPAGGGMVLDTRHVQAFVTVAAGFQNTAVATCPVGYVLTGCGFETSPGTDIFRSRQSVGFGTPDPALAVWRSCQATAQNTTTFTGQLFGNALCMRLIVAP